jgi:hypothetical protein
MSDLQIIPDRYADIKHIITVIKGINPRIFQRPLLEILELASEGLKVEDEEIAAQRKKEEEIIKLDNAISAIRYASDFVSRTQKKSFAAKAGLTPKRLEEIRNSKGDPISEDEKQKLCTAMNRSYASLWNDDRIYSDHSMRDDEH